MTPKKTVFEGTKNEILNGLFTGDLDDVENFKPFVQETDTFNNYFLDDVGIRNQILLAEELQGYFKQVFCKKTKIKVTEFTAFCETKAVKKKNHKKISKNLKKLTKNKPDQTKMFVLIDEDGQRIDRKSGLYRQTSRSESELSSADSPIQTFIDNQKPHLSGDLSKHTHNANPSPSPQKKKSSN